MHVKTLRQNTVLKVWTRTINYYYCLLSRNIIWLSSKKNFGGLKKIEQFVTGYVNRRNKVKNARDA